MQVRAPSVVSEFLIHVKLDTFFFNVWQTFFNKFFDNELRIQNNAQASELNICMFSLLWGKIL